MDSEYDENIFVKIVLNSTECLLIGLLYRSPTERLDGIDNNGNLNKLITEASNKTFSHILLMGDINYPDIDWECYCTNPDSVETADYKFLQSIQGNVVYQHVTKPTRFRGNDNSNVLDLIFTNEEDMVSDIEYLSPLGKTDHCVLHFQFNCCNQLKLNKRIRMCYDKGNYEEFNKAISETEWEDLLNPMDHINTNWTKLHDKIRKLEKKDLYLVDRSNKRQKGKVIIQWIRKH